MLVGEYNWRITKYFIHKLYQKCLQGQFDEAELVLRTAKDKYGGQFAVSLNLARSMEFAVFQSAVNRYDHKKSNVALLIPCLLRQKNCRKHFGNAQTSLVSLASLCDSDCDAMMELETRTGLLHLMSDSLPDAFDKLCQIVDRAREPGAQLHAHNVYALEKFADIQMVISL